jgi:hypothetical protein
MPLRTKSIAAKELRTPFVNLYEENLLRDSVLSGARIPGVNADFWKGKNWKEYSAQVGLAPKLKSVYRVLNQELSCKEKVTRSWEIYPDLERDDDRSRNLLC